MVPLFNGLKISPNYLLAKVPIFKTYYLSNLVCSRVYQFALADDLYNEDTNNFAYVFTVWPLTSKWHNFEPRKCEHF